MSDETRDLASPREPDRGRLGFVDVLDRAEIGAIVVDAQGGVTWCNPRLAQLLGRTTEEVLGADPVLFVVPERREATRRLFQDLAARAEESFQHDTEIELPGGERRVVRWTATILRGAGGFAGVACLAEDVTARRLAAQAHRLARAALDSSGTAFAMADERGRLVYVNPALLRLWRFRRDTEVLGRSVGEFWTDPAVADAVAVDVAREGHWEGELFARRADGSEATFRVHANSFEDPETATVRLIATFEDVTELRAIEDQLRWAQRLAQIGSWSIDLADRVITCGDEACRILGVSRERFAGTRDEFLALVYEGDRPRVHEAFARALVWGVPLGLDFHVVRPEGEERLIHAEARLLRDPAGRPQQLRGVFQDVTARVCGEGERRRQA
jgi:PAS domain S-box-containing protein